jgi:PAS domain S-box-containing protein
MIQMPQRDYELARLTRLYGTLSQVNQAIVWMPTRQELFQRVCQILVEHGGFRMAWLGWHDPQTGQLVPVAVAGDENDYIRSIKVYGDDRPEGRGPTGQAFRVGRPFICNDMQNDPITLAWRPELLRRGFHAIAVLPIRQKGEVRGTLSVYSDEPYFFQDREIALLDEAARNISFALDNLEREESRRLAEQTLRSEKQFTDTMMESMPGVLYFYDLSGRFLRWNRTFEAVTGYTAREIARMHPLDFFAGLEKTRVEERIAEVFEKGESSIEAEFVSRDGTARPYFFTGRRVTFEGKLCLVGVGIDVSERRRAQDRLAESERKYRELVEYANSIILRWNSEGRITFLNEFGQRFFGYTADEILGRHVLGTIVPDVESGGRDLRQLMDAICAAPEAFEQNLNENMRRGGERVWIAWTNRIVRDAEGRIVEILSIGSDMTERRRAEAERAKREQAEAADRIKSAFLATMSHELRTPLNSILGFTGIILQGMAGPLSDEQRKQLEMVRGSARHLLALVNDVLDISKIEAGQFEVACEPFDLRRSIAKVVATVRPIVDRKKLTLRIHIVPELHQAVGDERRFEQIVLNLLNNAVKFTERGEIALHAELIQEGNARPGAASKSAIRLRVADTGVGIKPEDLASLFQPFRQLDSGLSRKHEGTGLGLAICRRLAELMGGTIGVDSIWGQGSTFTVTLPLNGAGTQ